MYWMMGLATETEIALEGCVIKVLEDGLSIVDALSGFSNSVSESSEPQYVSFSTLETELTDARSLLLDPLLFALTKCSTLSLSLLDSPSVEACSALAKLSDLFIFLSAFSIIQALSRLLALWKLLFASSHPIKVTLVFIFPTESEDSLGVGSNCDLMTLRRGVHHGSVLAVIELSLDSSPSCVLQWQGAMSLS